MRRLQTWPRLLLTLPFAIRLAIVVVTTVLALAFYIISFSTLHNGNVLVIPCVLSAWVFKKRGLLLYLAVGILVGTIYHATRLQTLLWPLP
ncbi:MAG TPA: hypothetical protein VGT44_08565, partial [Ktedonobacteraceae bacterium]|nr:hypothetical protein [Ktedonobacteraceae bacterium]